VNAYEVKAGMVYFAGETVCHIYYVLYCTTDFRNCYCVLHLMSVPCYILLHFISVLFVKNEYYLIFMTGCCRFIVTMVYVNYLVPVNYMYTCLKL